MANTNSRTHYGAAPLASAKHANPNGPVDASQAEAGKGYELVGRSVTIARPRADLYEFWREFNNLGSFLQHVRSVRSDDPVRSHWLVGTGKQTIGWDSIVIEDIPNEVIAWRAVDGSQVTHEGRVEFRDAPSGRGTVVAATLFYDAPGGTIGKLSAQLFHRDAKTQARRELRRFKQLMETGEISTAAPPDTAPRA
jgi:uncharacterized membrane protein